MFSCHYDPKRLYFKSQDFENLVLLPFESIELYGPHNWKDILSLLYREYMKIPPEGRQVSGHDVVHVRI